MGLEPCEKGNSSYLRGQGVKNKLLTLELKLLSSVNGLFLTGACIVKAEIFYNINFISNGTDSCVVDYILFIRNKCIHTNFFFNVVFPLFDIYGKNLPTINIVHSTPTKTDFDPRDAVGSKRTSAQLFSTCYLYSPSHHIANYILCLLLLSKRILIFKSCKNS